MTDRALAPDAARPARIAPLPRSDASTDRRDVERSPPPAHPCITRSVVCDTGHRQARWRSQPPTDSFVPRSPPPHSNHDRKHEFAWTRLVTAGSQHQFARAPGSTGAAATDVGRARTPRISPLAERASERAINNRRGRGVVAWVLCAR